jgi:hypothetical protein
VLDAYVFETIEQVREITEDWLSEYNEERLHDSLGRVAPLTFMPRPIAAREGQFLNPQHSKKVCVEELDVTPLDPSLNILCSLPKEAAGIPLIPGQRLSQHCRRLGANGTHQIGVTPPFVKNCTLRREITRGMGLISGSTGLTSDNPRSDQGCPRSRATEAQALCYFRLAA